MTGKSYSMREMKTVVDYLTENKLYGEIKGRKMWMDFANSQQTTRTWQSLKETFLKRILPDIHNPYYKLTIEQVNSFRAGYDINEKNKNKLEIQTISEDSSSNGPKNTPVSNNGNDANVKEDQVSGEKVIPSKIPSRSRSSADTVIVDTCYETAEDIQKDLEGIAENSSIQTRSLRDCITYLEPLTPMLQEVLDDFQSEPENEPEALDTENQQETVPDTDNIESINEEVAKIVNESHKAKNADKDASEKTETIDNPVEKDSVKETEEKHNEPSKQDSKADEGKEPEVVCLDSPNEDDDEPKNKQIDNLNNKSQETANIVPSESAIPVTNNAEKTDVVVVNDSNSESIQPSTTLNNSNTQCTDASLPNNPEALNKRNSKENENEKSISPVTKFVNNTTRKRSNSENIKTLAVKKTRLDRKKAKATSETDSKTGNEITVTKKSKIEPQSKEMKVDDKPNKVDKETVKKIHENLPDILEKPSTSKSVEDDSVMDEADEHSSIMNDSSQIKNPCLQNVSLFDGQFGNIKYSTSESEPEPKKKLVIEERSIQKASKEKDENVLVKKNDVTVKQNNLNTDKKLSKQNAVVVLRSDSESDTEELPSPPKKRYRPGVSSKLDRERALANVFGFSSGAAHSKRRRQLSRRRRTVSQNIPHNNGGSNSSEWTSESDSEMYVSPPRGRKNRQTKKYLKPQSGRILSLEEEGGLFVMYGKKIYPLVKDGKLVKNYLTYLPESESEEEENYWKLKYVEEKKKADELKKLLEKTKEPRSRRSNSSTVLPAPSRKSQFNNQPDESTSHEGNEICLAGDEEKKEEIKSNSTESIKIKITTKNEQAIQLEGHWPHIQNVLKHVVHIFDNEPQPPSSPRPKTIVEPPSSSGLSTPVIITAIPEPSEDPEVHEKVNKIEKEIFKEIEERDKEELMETNEPESNNVTKRRIGRPRKSANTTEQQTTPSPTTRLRSDMKETEENQSTNEKISIEPESNASNGVKRQRTPRKVLNETANVNETKIVPTRKAKQKQDASIPAKNEDEEVRYMFPPKAKRQSIKTTDKKTSDKPQKSTMKSPNSFSSPETACPNSVDSTQGYQDSDPSPIDETRRKRRISHHIVNSKAKSNTRRITRQKLHPFLHTADSSNSSCGVPIKKVLRDNCTLNSEVYISDSYQLLMPKAKSSFKQLESIDETTPLGSETDFLERLDANSKIEAFSDPMNTEYHAHNSDQLTSDIGSSSNISLPMSPELSLVENISISKKTLSATEDRPTINEMMEYSDMKEQKTCRQYMISDIDISVPLMQQECELESCNSSDQKNEERKSLVTESLLSKIGTFNIDDQPNLTDTLDVKLRNLLLESAKKIESDNTQNNNKMDVDELNVQVQKKGRKRCSTPRKRKESKSKKAPKIQAVIEEERVESCSQGGRQSCPPAIQDMCDINPVNEEIANLTINEKVKTKAVKRKKDIIKVKILKPKAKKSRNSSVRSEQDSKTSVFTDSGINDTGLGILPVDVSVDLIHNHSETCLLANECVSDSIEFVENSMKSVLTLGDSMQSEGPEWNSQCEFSDAQNMSPDLYCNNAQDDRSFYKPKPDYLEDGETVYHSPASSLLTEDLSDDPPPPVARPDKWYLLSEDETTNANVGQVQPSSNVAGFGANLKQIFPLTCAVPDLSTITEMSRENDDSRKPTLEGATVDCLNSQKSELFHFESASTLDKRIGEFNV